MNDPAQDKTVEEAISTVAAILARGYIRYRNRRAVDHVEETYSDTQYAENEGVKEIPLDCAGD